MKKIKLFTMFFLMIFLLSGCNTTKKSTVVSIQNKPQTSAAKQGSLYEPPVSETKPDLSSPQSASKSQVKEIDGFVLLSSLDKDILIDLRYATSDNFTGKVVYPDNICVLRKGTAEKLVRANAELEKLGYRIKVWDAYRPVYVQKIFWNIVKDSRFVADPNKGGSIHNRGCAVDVTLVDKDGKELVMPSGFDDFSTAAYRTNSKMSSEAKKNMDILTKCMTDNGFATIDTEWWHFEDTDSKNYEIADIDLKQFTK